MLFTDIVTDPERFRVDKRPAVKAFALDLLEERASVSQELQALYDANEGKPLSVALSAASAVLQQRASLLDDRRQRQRRRQGQGQGQGRRQGQGGQGQQPVVTKKKQRQKRKPLELRGQKEEKR